ncbi:MFS transporter [Streptomyces tanashiensis]
MRSAGTAAEAPPDPGEGAVRGLTALLTTAMAFSMMQLFLLGALGPRLVDRLGVSETVLGLTTTVGFGTAAVLSPAGGRIVDRVGPRRALVTLLALSAVALALIGAAPGSGLLLVAVALGGLPQALANPATNKAILASVPAPRRGAVTGTKQSGVQLGAFVAGLPLAVAASAIGWRGAVWVAAGAALLAALWARRALPADASPPPRGTAGGPAPSRTGGPVPWLAAFSLFLGAGIASVNTYLALFGSRRLGMGPTVAGALVAVLGVAGIAGRARLVPGRHARPGPVAAGPARRRGGGSGLAPGRRRPCRPAGVGGRRGGRSVRRVRQRRVDGPGDAAVRARPGRAGLRAGRRRLLRRVRGGPALFGLLAERGRYGEGWVLVAAEFAVAGAVAVAWAVRDRRTRADGPR